jgi:DNA polymerase beta
MDKKEDIIKQLILLANDKKAKNDTFRYRAYMKAITALKDYEDEITTAKDLDKVKGLAKGSIKEKIIEFIETNRIPEVENITNESTVIQDLLNIYGIGPSKANELFSKYNITSIDDLKIKLKDNPNLLNDKQKIGLEYYKDLLKKIPRKEMEKHEEYITDFIKDIDKENNLIYEVTGSYRRGANKSGDIDVLCTTKTDNTLLFNEIIETLEIDDYIKETLAKGDKKFMGICKLHRYKTNRRLDMIYTNKNNYPFALLYFTGSGQFNIEMRNYALSLGYSLNEYGLKKENKFITNNRKTFETEEDIFKFLGLKFIEPEKRRGGIIDKLIIKK